jgi:hypothetical protein
MSSTRSSCPDGLLGKIVSRGTEKGNESRLEVSADHQVRSKLELAMVGTATLEQVDTPCPSCGAILVERPGA